MNYKYLLLLLAITLMHNRSAEIFAQQSEELFFENYASFATQEMYYKSSLIKGSDGYIYSCGATLNAQGNYDMILSKLTSANELVWNAVYAGTSGGDDFASDLVQDSQGNIIITGAEYISVGNYNAVTIKYSPTGSLIWQQSYNGAGNSYDGGISLSIDQTNNLYIVGSTFGSSTQSNFLTIKYNSSGTQLWTSTWDGIGLNDLGTKIAINGNQVALVGVSQQSASSWKMAAIYFQPQTGAFLGSRLSGGNTAGINRVSDVAIDANDNTYIIGSAKNSGQGLDVKVLKLSASYDIIWQQSVNGSANTDDEGLGLELTSNGDVVVCGYLTNDGTGKDVFASKLNGITGNTIWSAHYDEEGFDDKGVDLKLENDEEPIICCSSFKLQNIDFLLLKYSGIDGNLIAKARWNGDSNLNDSPVSIAIDNSDNSIYVVGQSEVTEGKFKYVNTKWLLHDLYLPINVINECGVNGYIQNRGQIRNVDFTSNEDIEFYSIKNHIGIYLEQTNIAYQIATINELDSVITDLYRVDLTFDKGNNDSKLYPISEKDEFYNFYLAHMAGKAERTSAFRGVVKYDVYDQIDMLFSCGTSGYKNYLVARPGSNLSNFGFSFEGQSSISMDNSGNLIIGMGAENLTQLAPLAYSLDETSGELTLLSWQPTYSITDNIVKLASIQPYNGVLVITFEQASSEIQTVESVGNLDWSTFIGNNGEDQSLDVVADANENVWVVGEESSFPFSGNIGSATINIGFQFLGDAYVAKFTDNCRLQYMTVWGGNNYDRAYSVDLGENNQIYVVGATQSDNITGWGPNGIDYNFFQGGFGDGFYLKLDVSGIVLVDSYIGGAGIDVCTGVSFRSNLDGSKEVWIAGYANNNQNFPISPNSNLFGAYSGMYDGFVLRLNGITDQLMLGRWVGSQENDFITDIDDTPGGPMFIGITKAESYSTSQNMPPTDGKFPNYTQNQGFHHPWFDTSQSDLGNYFLGRIDNTTNTLNWTTSFGAAPMYLISESKPCIAIKNFGLTTESPSTIYICGTVRESGSASFPLYSNAGTYNQNESGGNDDAFIASFRAAGSGTIQQVWCSFFGGLTNENAFGLAIDKNSNVFMTGWFAGANLQLSNDGCQVPSNGEFPICNYSGANYMETDNLNSSLKRTFIASFDQYSNILWSTEFGSGDFNTGRSLAVGSDKLFLTGISSNTWSILEFDPNSTLDYFQNTISGIQDGTIARFDIPIITGVEEMNAEVNSSFAINLYPNPANNILHVSLANPAANVSFKIFNSVGQIVDSKTFNTGAENLNVDISKLNSGVYRIVFSLNNNNTVSCGFIKE